MKFKALLFVILVAAILVVSGCAGKEREVKTTDNDGIIINEFTADPIRANADEDVVFYLDFENTGGTTATNVRANLYNAEGWTPAPVEKTFGSLSPPNINTQPQTPGGFKIAQWKLQPNNPLEGVESPRTITARVRYHYKTTSQINIPLYTEDEYNRRTQTSAEINTVTVSNAKAPVSVGISPSSVLQFDTKDSQTTFSELITLTNIGSGVPIGTLDNVETDGVIGGTITLTGPAEFSDCLGATSGKSITIPAGGFTIRRADSDKALCDIVVKNSFLGSSPMATIGLTFNLDYDYYVEASATVTVVGVQ